MLSPRLQPIPEPHHGARTGSGETAEFSLPKRRSLQLLVKRRLRVKPSCSGLAKSPANHLCGPSSERSGPAGRSAQQLRPRDLAKPALTRRYR